MRVVPVTADQFDNWKSRIEWHLASFAQSTRGALAPDYYEGLIKSRHSQCWIALEGEDVRAVCLTQIRDDALNTCVITHCAGDSFSEWIGAVHIIKAWAKEAGCQRIEAITRPGWERYLRTHGFKKTHVILDAEI